MTPDFENAEVGLRNYQTPPREPSVRLLPAEHRDATSHTASKTARSGHPARANRTSPAMRRSPREFIESVPMVDISRETAEQTELRLRRVITQAQLVVYPGLYRFDEFPLDRFPDAARSDALALVRDDHVWSQLVPCDETRYERFGLFRFHFPEHADNSGFVGWLATHLKRRFGTGVFVTCGQNSAAGGIFDYWGVPAELADLVFQEVGRLVQGDVNSAPVVNGEPGVEVR
ncbi:DUF6196 family protein [Burkholderia gladioli]|uniref:DUF6196 family protein n=1 Tax=Burkholderia gladioli TaxID=28095 RepID=UPI003F7952EA